MTRTVFLRLGAGAVATPLAGAMVLSYLSALGGLHASYRARDGDLLLTRMARKARPIIDALDQFRAARGAFPDPGRPADQAAVAIYLPPTVKITLVTRWLMFDAGGPAPWIYLPGGPDGSSYSLSVKLGWDPRLVYLRTRDHGRWVFVPGDGSDEIMIALRP